MFPRLTVTAVLAVVLAHGVRSAEMAEIADAMQDAQFAKAVQLLDPLIAKGEKPLDALRYLRALALLYDKKYPESIAAADELLKAHGDSRWARKARYLQARALLEQKKFMEAEAIYKAEAARLLSAERKQELAGVYIELAEAFSAKPEKNQLDAPAPDYARAYNLYREALELEISPDLRDELLYRSALMMELAQEFGQAVEEYTAYLVEFEPEWGRLEGGDPAVVRRPGKHRFEARQHLADCDLKSGNLGRAQKRLRDLLAAEGVPAETVREARLLLARSFGLPTPESDEALEQGVAAARAFLTAYPDDPGSLELAYQIAQAYAQRGRSEEARAAYEDFIAGKGYALPGGDAASKRDETGKTPLEKHRDLKMSATFELGQLLLSQGKLDDAIKVWQSYIAQFPNGPQWAEAQESVIGAEFEKGVKLLEARKYDEARAIWEEFLRNHPLDGHAPLIGFIFGEIPRQRALAAEKDKKADPRPLFTEAIAEWQRLVAKYPGAEESSLAQFNIGLLYEEKLGDREAALEAYRKLNWGSWAGQAQARIAQMTQKHLALSTERVFRTNEPAKIKLSLRNVEKLTCKLYRLDLEEYFRKKHAVHGIEALDLSLIDPNKTWEIKVDGYEKFKPIQQEVEIPFDGAGVCAVNVATRSEGDEADFEATTLVIRSDIDTIVKASRKEALVFVEDMVKAAPVAGARVILSNGQKILVEGVTGPDGVYRARSSELLDARLLSVFAVKESAPPAAPEKHVCAGVLDLGGLGFSRGLAPKGYIYTDRPAYRPGQPVQIRGILRDVDAGAYVVREGEVWIVAVADSRGRVIFQDELKLSKFGTFAATVELSESAALGEYRISLTKKSGQAGSQPSFTSSFLVQTFKLEKVKLTMDFARPVYFRGEAVEGTIRAAYYYGTPLVGKPIRYTLPDGRSYVAPSDQDGKVAFKFDTTSMLPPRLLAFEATIDGENVRVSGSVFLAKYGFSIGLTLSDEVVLAGAPFEVLAVTKAADGKPSAEALQLEVLRQETVQPDPVIAAVPWLQERLKSPSAEVKIAEQKLATDPKTGEVRAPLKLDKGGSYVVRVRGADRFNQPVVAQAAIFVSDADDATKLRIFAETSHLKVGTETTVKLHSRLEPTLALVTFEGEEIIGYRVQKIEKEFNDLKFAVEHTHFPNFTLGVAAIYAGVASSTPTPALFTASKDFTVERQLNVTLKPEKDACEPGAELKLAVETTDQLGKPVSAELSLALVDSALFALFPDRTPAIRAFFEEGARRVSAMRSTTSATFAYAAQTRRVVKEILEEEQRLAEEKEEAVQEGGAIAGFDAGTVVPNAPPAAKGQLGTAYRTGRKLAEAKKDNKQEEAAVKPMAPRQAVAALAADELAQAGEAEDARTEDRRKARGRGDEAERPRVEFEGAGFWAPAVLTDAAGKTVVPIRMPEKMALWRLTSRGCTPETLVGEATAEVLTKKDFFVELRVPSVLVEGDKPRFLLRAHNLTDEKGDGEFKLKMTIAGNSKVQTKKAALPARGSAEVVFDALPVDAGSRVELEASGTLGALADAITMTTPIMPWGIEHADTEGGTIQTPVTAFLELPKRTYNYRQLSVLISPSLRRTVIDLAIDPPGVELPWSIVPPRPSCGAASELLAVASALDYIKDVQAEATDNLLLTRRAQALVSNLTSSQRDDGGWSWCPGNVGSDPLVSARTLWALAAARAQGIAVSADTIQKALAFLKNAFSGLPQDDNDGKSIVLHALSCLKEADFGFANRLYRSRNELSNLALAYSALTFANLERKEIAGEILDVLEKRPKETDGRAAWPADQKTEYLASDLEVTALSLLALERVRPQSPAVKKAADHLLASRQDCGWGTTDTRGAVAAALALYFKSVEYVANDYELAITVNEKEVKKLKVQGEQPTVLVEVPTHLLVEGKNKVTLDFNGRGRFSYAITLRGFSPEIASTAPWGAHHQIIRWYYHAPLEYKGRQISSSSSPVTQLALGERTFVQVQLSEYGWGRPRTVEEYLPVGTNFVPDSLSGNFSHYEVADGKLILYYPRQTWISGYSYQLVAHAPGTYRVMPPVVRDAAHPELIKVGSQAELTVLPPGEKSTDPYKMNSGELFGLGSAYFNDGLYREAKEYLLKLWTSDRNFNEREVARMLLWIHTEKEHYDARRLVEYFEVLKERYPELTIPFDKILVVGRAYHDVEEYERAYLVYRAAMDTSFVNDSNICEVLEQQGLWLCSFEQQYQLLFDYPDTPPVVSAHLSVSQSLYNRLPQLVQVKAEYKALVARPAASTPPTRVVGSARPTGLTKLVQGRWGKEINRVSYLAQITRLLNEFLLLYPTDSLADDAAFSLANALLEGKDYTGVVELCQKSQRRYPKSNFLTSFQYVEGLGYFYQREYKDAIEAVTRVADRQDQNRDLARYILAQIYHAENKPVEAIGQYREIAGVFPDAAEAIRFFEEKRLSIEEVTLVKPKERAELKIRHRNIQTVHVQLHRVDLMKLYLQERNLSRIANIQLAGIKPLVDQSIDLGKEKFVEKQTTVKLDLQDEGAYLAICRGEDLFASGLVLISPLELKIQEEPASGRLRVNVVDTAKGAYAADVHVKAIGSMDSQFRSGDTDLRGIFVADGLRGTATVIARDKQGRYAFYRGMQWLGPAREAPPPAPRELRDTRLDYAKNIMTQNAMVQQGQVQQLKQLRSGKRAGVEVQAAR